MIGLTSLEVYSTFFNKTYDKNKLEFYSSLVLKKRWVTYEKLKDEIEKDLDLSVITATDLQSEIIVPIILEEYRKKVSKGTKSDKHISILAAYTSSVFQDFEAYLRTEVDLVEDAIRLVSNEHNSSFITYEMPKGIYKLKDIFEFLAFNVQRENDPSHSINIEVDEITMKTKLVVRSSIIAIRFDEKSFFSFILGFNSNWDYKHSIEYISQRNYKDKYNK